MSATAIGVNDAKAVKRYSTELAVDVSKESYWNRKFMGRGQKAMTPIQLLTELESDAGEQISYDLVLRKRMKPVQGDNTLRGREEDLKFATDVVYIDQLRGGTNTGGRMSRKRTVHDLREQAKPLEAQWWSQVFDETIFLYLSGGGLDSGTGASVFANADYIEESGFVGYAGNTFRAPDASHRLYGGNATGKADLDSSDIMSLSLLDRAVARAKTLRAASDGTPIPALQPIKINGEDHFVCVMHPFQEYDLRTSSGSEWLNIQKAAATAEGRNNPIFKGGLGMYNNVVLHDHASVIQHSNYGSGANLPAARALFLGRQAGVVAFGSPGTGLRFGWNEEMEDRGNQVVITTNSIIGVNKSTYTINGTAYDFGVMAMDTYAANPS